jgi:sulfate permease, SulP family
VTRYLPILGWLPRYERRTLPADALAGLSVWALLVPQSLAYATLAGVPVQYGLYTAFAALLMYPIFGTSRQLAEGPSAAVCAVVAATITPLVGAAALGTGAAAPYAAALALATGVVYVVLGLLRMGWVSTFLSKAVMAGFILGFAIGIIINQIHSLLGTAGSDGSYLEQLWRTIGQIPDADLTTVAVGCGSLAVLLALRRVAPKMPRALIVMALAIGAVDVFSLAGHGVAVTGDVPTGLFTVGIPDVPSSDIGKLLLGALAVIFVGYSESLAAARAMATKHGYEIDPNQELIAQGAACGASGLIGGFAVDGSLSKSSVADAAGQQTQMASLINAVFILLTLLFLASIFANLPTATLGAVVIDALVGLLTLTGLRRYLNTSRADFVFFAAAMLGILAVGIIAGILIGVALSLLLLIAHSSRTSVRPLGREPVSGVFPTSTTSQVSSPIPRSSSCGSTARCSSPTPTTSARASTSSRSATPRRPGWSSTPSPSSSPTPTARTSSCRSPASCEPAGSRSRSRASIQGASISGAARGCSTRSASTASTRPSRARWSRCPQ